MLRLRLRQTMRPNVWTLDQGIVAAYHANRISTIFGAV